MQCLTDRFRLFPWVLSKRINNRISIKSIERKHDTARVEVRNQTLLLICSNSSTTSVIELEQELFPGFFKTFVGGSRIGYGLYERASLITNTN